MKIVIITFGTRGDTQPFVSLANALSERGHKALICGAPASAAFVKACGIEFAPIGADFEIFELAETRRLLREGKVAKYFRDGAHRVGEMWGGMGPQLTAATKDADLIVCAGILSDWGWCLAQKLNVPLVLAYTFPLVASGDYANHFVTSLPVPTRTMRRLTHSLFNWGSWRHLRPLVDEFRRNVGAPPTRRPVVDEARAAGVYSLHMWSSMVFPRPSDWTPRDTLTGYWRFPSELRSRLGEGALPAGLKEWLGRGSAPVFVAFGSMPVESADATLLMAAAAAARLGMRIICSFAGRVYPTISVGESAFVIGAVDQDWLLPQCVAAVHHGGAGTTGASLIAGIPTIICSVFADQPFWGNRVADLKVGAHLPFAKLSEKSLAATLKVTMRRSVQERARAIGARLRGEDGLGKAVEVIESQLRSSSRNRSPSASVRPIVAST